MKRIVLLILTILCLAITGNAQKTTNDGRPRGVDTLPALPCSPQDFVQLRGSPYTTSVCKNGAWETVATGAISAAPTAATFITQTANATLTNEQALSALATGLLKNTTTTGVLSIAGASDLPSGIDAAKIGGGGVSTAEFDFLGTVTSNVQSQIDLKAPLASPTFTGTVTFPTPFTLGAVSVLPTGTELNFVDGVTSAIQTQLDAKQATITFGTGVQTALGVNVGSAGAPVVNGGALGTPSSGTGTNITGVNAATLGGATFAAPGAIGGGTAAAGTFLSASVSKTSIPTLDLTDSVTAKGRMFKATTLETDISHNVVYSGSWNLDDTSVGASSFAMTQVGIYLSFFTAGGNPRTKNDVLLIGPNGATFPSDNAYDFGASGAARPRTGYFGTSVITPLLTATNIGAFTLGGTVSGGGNQINNVIIGTVTPLAGAFTTMTATSLIASTASAAQTGVQVKSAGSDGSVKLGSGSGESTGTISWHRFTSDQRLGYMGFNATNVQLNLENSAAFSIAGGHFIFANDNTNDIGASGATRPRTGYFGTSLDVPTITSASSITGGAGNMTITSGTGASRTMIFKTTTSGSTATTALTLNADQSATFPGSVTAADLSAGSNGLILGAGNVLISYGGASGRIKLAGAGNANFDLLYLGGTTSSFPAIKRNSTGIDFRLADDSAYAPIAASTATLSTSNTVPVVIGGTGTTATLALRPTSGAGTTGADIVFQNGTNGGTEIGRFFNTGQLALDTTTEVWGNRAAVPGAVIHGQSGGVLFGRSTDNIFSSNGYADAASTWRYQTTQAAVQVLLYQGAATIRTAASGSAAGAITWANQFVVGNTGIITLNTTNYNACTALTTTAGVLGCTVSDERVKDHITPFGDGLSVVRRINPITFQFSEGTQWYKGGRTELGLSAQNLKAANPLLATSTGNALNLLQPEPMALHAIEIDALKKLDARVTELEKENARLRQLAHHRR